jgi:uncharacterized protein (TIGR03435 family)
MSRSSSLIAPFTIGILSAYAGLCQSSAFDVASVKINNAAGRPNPVIQYSPDTLTIRDTSLWLIVRWAYGMESFQISAPDSIQVPPFYDIIAKAQGAVPESQLRLMLRTLLADRFHLTVHREKKEMPVTALLVAKGGPKFHESDGTYNPALGAEMPLHFLGYGEDVHMQRSRDPDGRLRDSFTNIPMTLFAGVVAGFSSLTPYDKVPVVDMTGLPGRYDLIVFHDLSGHREGDAPPTAEDMLADFKPLLEKQLGLTLEPRRAMVEVLVIDHVDREPTPN